MGTVWASLLKHVMHHQGLLRATERWDIRSKKRGRNCCLHRRRHAMVNSCYGTLESRAILQSLFKGHFLTVLATGPATDTHKRASPWPLPAHTLCCLNINTQIQNRSTQCPHSPPSLYYEVGFVVIVEVLDHFFPGCITIVTCTVNLLQRSFGAI